MGQRVLGTHRRTHSIPPGNSHVPTPSNCVGAPFQPNKVLVALCREQEVRAREARLWDHMEKLLEREQQLHEAERQHYALCARTQQLQLDTMQQMLAQQQPRNRLPPGVWTESPDHSPNNSRNNSIDSLQPPRHSTRQQHSPGDPLSREIERELHELRSESQQQAQKQAQQAQQHAQQQAQHAQQQVQQAQQQVQQEAQQAQQQVEQGAASSHQPSTPTSQSAAVQSETAPGAAVSETHGDSAAPEPVPPVPYADGHFPDDSVAAHEEHGTFDEDDWSDASAQV